MAAKITEKQFQAFIKRKFAESLTAVPLPSDFLDRDDKDKLKKIWDDSIKRVTPPPEVVWSIGRSPSDWLKVFAKINVDCRNLNLFRQRRNEGTYHEHPDTTRYSKSVRLAIADLPPAYSDEMTV